MASDVFLELLGDGSTDEPEDFEIYEDMREAVESFLCCSGQWRFMPNGAYLALDHAALLATLIMLNIEDKRAVYLDVRAMELAAAEELNRG